MCVGVCGPTETQGGYTHRWLHNSTPWVGNHPRGQKGSWECALIHPFLHCFSSFFLTLYNADIIMCLLHCKEMSLGAEGKEVTGGVGSSVLEHCCTTGQMTQMELSVQIFNHLFTHTVYIHAWITCTHVRMFSFPFSCSVFLKTSLLNWNIKNDQLLQLSQHWTTELLTGQS